MYPYSSVETVTRPRHNDSLPIGLPGFIEFHVREYAEAHLRYKFLNKIKIEQLLFRRFRKLF